MSYPPTDPINQPPPFSAPHPSSGVAPLRQPDYDSLRYPSPAFLRAFESMIAGLVGLVAGILVYYILVFVPGNPISTASHTPVLFGFITLPAIIAIAVPWAISIVAIVLGHISLAQGRRGMADGRAYAIVGLVLGYGNIILPVAGLALDVI